MKDNSEILKNQTIVINNSKQDAGTHVQQFLESWSHAIQESNFELAKKSMERWKNMWTNISNENVKIYTNVLKVLETSWENTQSKNIE